jgi:hypothetical protein
LLLIPKNASVPSDGAFIGRKVILVRLLQDEKASDPMLVTPSGIVMLVRLLQ